MFIIACKKKKDKKKTISLNIPSLSPILAISKPAVYPIARAMPAWQARARRKHVKVKGAYYPSSPPPPPCKPARVLAISPFVLKPRYAG